MNLVELVVDDRQQFRNARSLAIERSEHLQRFGDAQLLGELRLLQLDAEALAKRLNLDADEVQDALQAPRLFFGKPGP